MRRFAVAALALILTACGASAPPPPLVPPKPEIVAMVRPPAAVAPAPVPETRVIDHKNWAITVPGDWTVADDTEEGVTVTREKGAGVKPARLQVVTQDLGDVPPEAFVRIVSITAEQQVPEGVTVTDVQRQAGLYHDRPSSITQVLTDKGVFLGVFATVDVANNTGYVVISIAPMTKDDAKLMATITQTLVIKAAPGAPKEEEATPAPAPAPKKATPKKK